MGQMELWLEEMRKEESKTKNLTAATKRAASVFGKDDENDDDAVE